MRAGLPQDINLAERLHKRSGFRHRVVRVGYSSFFSQVVRFFGAVGEGLEEEVASRKDESPVWLSTSGLGVYW